MVVWITLGFCTVAACSFALFLLYHLSYPFLLKDFSFFQSLLLFGLFKTPPDLLSCLGLKNTCFILHWRSC